MATVSEISAKLQAALKSQGEWLSKAGPLIAELDAARRALEERTVRELNDHAAEIADRLGKMPPTTTLAWSDGFWGAYAGGLQAPMTVARLGKIAEGGTMRGERGLTGLPAAIPFLSATGAVLVLCDGASQPLARSLIQSLILRAAITMPAETRFSLIDPVGLGAAFPMRGLLPRVRSTGRSLADELTEVLDDIRRVNQDVIGHAARFAELSSQERAGEQFEIIGVMDFPEAYRNDPRSVDQLVKVANSGPRAGRHLVLEVRTDLPLPRDFSLDHFKDAYQLDLRGRSDLVVDQLPPGAEQKRLVETAVKTGSHARAGDWATLVEPDQYFAMSAARRVETPIGERVGLWLGDADDGQPSAHAMIAGQTGSGKSYLLHVLITGLASRYSPDELRLVLIDGKQGVEFKAYEGLPHADVVCLNTSPEMARSVLEDFAAEMEERYERFQKANAVKLEDYRAATREVMPRKLLIVDEYQQLLQGDPERGARLLTRVLEKGRAAGTHLILGSQTFNVQGLPASALSHVHLRVSLSLAQDYLQGIQVFGPEGKRLIRELAPSGEVVVNQESGRDGANKRTAVARLPKGESGSNALIDAVSRIIAAAQPAVGGQARQPIVLSGRDGAVLRENPFVVYWRNSPPAPEVLQKVARQPVRQSGFGVETWSLSDGPLPLWLGRKFDVRGHALAVLRRAPANNMLVLGTQASIRLNALANALAGLAGMVPAQQIRLDVIDGMIAGLPGENLLRAGCGPLHRKHAQIGFWGPGDAEAVIKDVAADVASRVQAGSAARSMQRVLVLSEPEYITALHSATAQFGPAPTGAAGLLREILLRGPQAGVHVILTASGLSSVASLLNPTRELRAFSHRVVQQMNEDDSMTLFASLIGARIAEQADHPFAMLHVDLMQGVRAGSLFKAYSSDPDIFAAQDAHTLHERLSELFP